MSGIVKEINDYSVTFCIYHNGQRIKITEEMKRFMANKINEILKEEYECKICVLNDDVSIFQRAKKKKKFTPEQVQQIKNDPDSIRKKAIKYKTSTRTIMKIMKGQY